MQDSNKVGERAYCARWFSSLTTRDSGQENLAVLATTFPLHDFDEATLYVDVAQQGG